MEDGENMAEKMHNAVSYILFIYSIYVLSSPPWHAQGSLAFPHDHLQE